MVLFIMLDELVLAFLSVAKTLVLVTIQMKAIEQCFNESIVLNCFSL